LDAVCNVYAPLRKLIDLFQISELFSDLK